MKKKLTTQRAFLWITGTFILFSCAVFNKPDEADVRQELLDLRCTEINYNPVGIDSTDADMYEFIELKNAGSSTISLADVAFSNGIDFTFSSDAKVDAGGFIVLAVDENGFKRRYGIAPFGIYTGKLNNAGEKIALRDLKAQNTFLEFEYNDKSPWPEAADGAGRTLVPMTNNAIGDPNNASYWRASFKANGSPGEDDPGIVLVNEAHTHTDLPEVDAIELYNPNDNKVDIGGWYLTDRKVDPQKYQIPDGTTVPANGYLVIDETAFNADPALTTSFRFSEHGEEVYLFSSPTGVRGDYMHGFAFGEIENGVSFGRYVTSDGREEFVAQKAVTLGEKNAGPIVGPVVISEIMYNPKDSISEYVELKNISDAEVHLYDVKVPDNTWHVGGLEFAFPKSSSLKPGEIVLIASTLVSTDAFKTMYDVPSGTQIFSLPRLLGNKNDSLVLLKPEEPYIDTAHGMATVNPSMVRERILYSDGGDWPSDADGKGSSLERINLDAYGNDPDNWKAAKPTAGK
jgi:hypothetical protein